MSRPLLVQDMLATSTRLFSCLQKFIKEALGDGQLVVNTTHLFRFTIWFIGQRFCTARFAWKLIIVRFAEDGSRET